MQNCWGSRAGVILLRFLKWVYGPKLIDIKTFEFLKDSVLYYKVNNVNDLANKIMFLLQSPDRIINYKNKLAKYKKKFMRTWRERIDQEIKILEGLVKK